MDTTKSADQRAHMLLGAMTLDDKLNMVAEDDYYFFPYGSAGYIQGNPNLCIPDLVLNDAGSGVANAQIGTTSFPVGIAQGATWDPGLEERFGQALGAEAWQKGVNVWLGPGVNIGRVPMNGRNFEYVGGEDPILAGAIASAAIRGVQSQHVIATVKHYAANNQETDRMTVSADIDERTMHEIYLPAFEASVDAGVGSAMCSYNRVDGTYACENPHLLTGELKQEFGFSGFVMSDWGAQHSTVASAKAGLDMEMNGTGANYYGAPLKTAVQDGQVPLSTLNDMVVRILRSMFRVGLFDHPISHTLPGPAVSDASTPDHVALARTIAEDSTVLLKNDGSILPLSGSLHRIAVIGHAAGVGAKDVCGGGGSSAVLSCNTNTVTPLQGITQRAAADSDVVLYADGTATADAVAAAKAADVAIVFASKASSEGSDVPNLSLGNGTRVCASLLVGACEEVPSDQDALITSVAAANPNTIVVLSTPGPVVMPWLANVKGLLEAWYPGIEDGNAIAAILFGDVNPSAKLPETFPRSESDLPTSTPQQYPGKNGHAKYSEDLLVGYRWYDARDIGPLFPFGFGLSYTTFRYSDLVVTPTTSGAEVRFTITNTGTRGGAEVGEVYVGFPKRVGEPPRELKGFDKVFVQPGQSTVVTVPLDRRAFSYWDARSHEWTLAAGTYTVSVGGSSRSLPLHTTIEPAAGGASSARVLAERRPAPRTPAASLPATGEHDAPIIAVALLFVLAAVLIRTSHQA